MKYTDYLEFMPVAFFLATLAAIYLIRQIARRVSRTCDAIESGISQMGVGDTPLYYRTMVLHSKPANDLTGEPKRYYWEEGVIDLSAILRFYSDRQLLEDEEVTSVVFEDGDCITIRKTLAEFEQIMHL